MRVNYHEKQFEVFFQDAISATDDVQYAPIGQVIEAKVGYDLGLNAPNWHSIWRRLGTPYLRGGAVHTWNHRISPQDAVSASVTNVFFQFKRPDHLFGHNAAFYKWFNSDYFRFSVDRSPNPPYPTQHELLEDLEAQSNGRAVVRYAAPACRDYAELEATSYAGTLLDDTVFVAPSRFSPGHKRCSYTGSSNAIFNPVPERIIIEKWPAFGEQVAQILSRAGQVSDAVAEAFEWALALRGESAPKPSQRPIAHPDLSPESSQLFHRASLSANEFRRLGLTWLFAIGPR